MRKRIKLFSVVTLGLCMFTLSFALAPAAFAGTLPSTGSSSTGSSTSGTTDPSKSTYDPTATTEVSETALFTGVTRSCWDEGSCTLCDILVVFINIADGILKLFAILASVFFVWGAGYMMMSSGNAQMVEKGKGIIKATIIGSIIVLFSWQLMNTVVFVLVKQGDIFEGTETGQTKEVKYSPLAWYNVADWCGTVSGSTSSPSSSSSSSSSGSSSAPSTGNAELDQLRARMDRLCAEMVDLNNQVVAETDPDKEAILRNNLGIVAQQCRDAEADYDAAWIEENT